jgi:hypothetical protein
MLLTCFSTELDKLVPLLPEGDGMMCGPNAVAASYNAITNPFTERRTSGRELLEFLFSSWDNSPANKYFQGTPTAAYKDWVDNYTLIPNQLESIQSLLSTRNLNETQRRYALSQKNADVRLGVIKKTRTVLYQASCESGGRQTIWTVNGTNIHPTGMVERPIAQWMGIGHFQKNINEPGLREVARWGFKHPLGDGNAFHTSGASAGRAHDHNTPHISRSRNHKVNSGAENQVQAPDCDGRTTLPRGERRTYGNKPSVDFKGKKGDCKKSFDLTAPQDCLIITSSSA